MDMLNLHGVGSGSGGSNTVYDIIRNYIVSSDGNISVGDVCEFVNGKVRKTFNQKQVSEPFTFNSVWTENINAVPLDNRRILIMYSNNNDHFARAVVITLTNAGFTVGTSIQLNSLYTNVFKVIALDSTHALVSYGGPSLSFTIVTLTITDNTISIGSTLVLSANGSSPSFAKISSTKVVLFYNSSGSSLMCVLTYENSTLTTNTPVTFFSQSASNIKAVALDSTHLIVSYTYSQQVSSSYYNYFDAKIILLQNGTTLSSGNVVNISGASSIYVSYTEFMAFDRTRAVLIYGSPNSSGNSGPGMAVVIYYDSNSNKLFLSDQLKFESNSYSRELNIDKLDSTHIVIYYNSCTTANTYCTISIFSLKEDITLNLVSTYVTFSGTSSISYICMKKLFDNCLFLLYEDYTSPYYGMARLISTEDYVINRTVRLNSVKPDLIALSTGSAGEIIRCQLKGVAKGLSNLQIGKSYYVDDFGNLTTEETENTIGLAISETELLKY